MDQGIKGVSPFNVAADLHTAGSDTIFVQIYMDPPPGVPGVSKDAPGSTKHAIWGLVR